MAHLCFLIITYHHQTYKKAKSKYEKSAVVSAIVDSIESSSAEGGTVGGFVRKDADKDRWYQVGDIIAREKVSYDVPYLRYLS